MVTAGDDAATDDRLQEVRNQGRVQHETLGFPTRTR